MIISYLVVMITHSLESISLKMMIFLFIRLRLQQAFLVSGFALITNLKKKKVTGCLRTVLINCYKMVAIQTHQMVMANFC